MGTFDDLMTALTLSEINENDSDLYILRPIDGDIHRGPFTITGYSTLNVVELKNAVKVTYPPDISRSIVPSAIFYYPASSVTPTEYFLHDAHLRQRLESDMSPEEVDKVMDMFSL